MGDRGNIIVKTQWEGKEPEAVYLYSHWSGHELPEILQRALKRKQRWDDNQYLALTHYILNLAVGLMT